MEVKLQAIVWVFSFKITMAQIVCKEDAHLEKSGPAEIISGERMTNGFTQHTLHSHRWFGSL